MGVDQLEKAFDLDPDRAMADYGSRRLRVTGTVASVDGKHITFRSAYLLNVQAYFTGDTVGLAEGKPATVDCDELERRDWPTGAKPVLRRCFRPG